MNDLDKQDDQVVGRDIVNIDAHDEPEGYAAGEQYFPKDMGDRHYYHPVSRGLEIKIAEKLARLRELDRKHNK